MAGTSGVTPGVTGGLLRFLPGGDVAPKYQGMAVAGSQLPQVRRGLALINNPVWSRPSLDPCVVER